MERVGFIGLGQMGKPMARNLLNAGYSLTVYNRSKPPMEELASHGAKMAGSPSEVGSSSDVVILSLPYPETVKQVVLGAGGVVEGIHPGGVVIDTSTTDPLTARELYEELRKRGVGFLDAPVSGGPEGAEAATLTFMVGGENKDLERCMPILRAMGRHVFHVGGPGAGQGVKLVNQILVAIHTLAAAEAMLFASSLGLDLGMVLEVIQRSAGDSFIFRRVAPQFIARKFGRGWQTYLIHKDLGLVLKTAERLKLPMLLSSLAHEKYGAAITRGLEKIDSAAVIKVLEQLAGLNDTTKTND